MLVLVGNKCDLDQRREVARDVAQQYAASIGAIFLETSAMDETGEEVDGEEERCRERVEGDERKRLGRIGV